MKKVMFAFFALAVSVSVASANPVVVASSNNSYMQAQDDRVKIDPEELPDAVKTTLKGDEYTGWEISTAYKNTKDNTYEVELSNGTEKVTKKFDKEGNKID